MAVNTSKTAAAFNLLPEVADAVAGAEAVAGAADPSGFFLGILSSFMANPMFPSTVNIFEFNSTLNL
jgi:hypothetical protein